MLYLDPALAEKARITRATYDAILYLHYDSEENIFYDECGRRTLNIFEMITPNDLLLFKKDPKCCYFQHRKHPTILCSIILDFNYINEEAMYEQNIKFDRYISCGSGCRFSCQSEIARAEICYTCGGRD